MSQNNIDLIGKDIKMNADLSDIATEKSDVSTVEGNENLAQAVLLRLRNPVGALPIAYTFGSRLTQLMGKGQSRENEYLAHLMVGEALMRETRQVSVDNMNIRYHDDELNISFTVIGINSTEPVNIGYSFRV